MTQHAEMFIDVVHQVQKDPKTGEATVSFVNQQHDITIAASVVSDPYLMELLGQSQEYRKNVGFELGTEGVVSNVFFADEDDVSTIKQEGVDYAITHKGSDGVFKLSADNPQQELLLSVLQQAQSRNVSFSYITDAFLEYRAIKLLDE